VKIAYKALLFILCINMAIYIKNAAGITPIVSTNTPVKPEDVIRNFNSTKPATTWGGWTDVFTTVGDIIGGMTMLFNAARDLIFGFPYLLQELGAPSIIVYPIYAIWCFVFFMAFIEWRSGRSITGE